MKSIINGFLAVSSLLLVFSCADYNETDNFTAESGSSYVIPYKDLAPVKSYINRDKYPNMTLGATLKVTDFNKQALEHAAAVTNFDNYAFGSTLMPSSIVNEKGVMNFLSMMDLLGHVQEIGGEVFGSPIFANANQAEGWLTTLTAPIEIKVDPIEDKYVDYTTMDEFTGTSKRGKPVIVKNYDGDNNALKLPKRSMVYIVEGFDLDPTGNYTITFYAQVDKDETVICTFADYKIQEGTGDKATDKKFSIKAGGWKKITIEDLKPLEGVTAGYFMIEGNLNSDVYIKEVKVAHNPDNHRPQTEQEVKDTINYAINTWCDNLMKYNEGRIKSFDLIDEAIDTKTLEGTDYFDLKHSTEKVFWQDILGSAEYAPVVSKVAAAAYEKYGGEPAALKFFISESGLDEPKKMESLKYWMNIWEKNGAKIDGINAKLNIFYSEDEATQAETVNALNTLLDNLAQTGKLIRLSNFDIKYKDATGANVTVKDITAEQRQKLADFYGYVLKRYMETIPNEKQAGVCKGNMSDTASDPVGLWAVDSKTKDWVRTATYKAFCDVLSGKE